MVKIASAVAIDKLCSQARLSTGPPSMEGLYNRQLASRVRLCCRLDLVWADVRPSTTPAAFRLVDAGQFGAVGLETARRPFPFRPTRLAESSSSIEPLRWLKVGRRAPNLGSSPESPNGRSVLAGVHNPPSLRKILEVFV